MLAPMDEPLVVTVEADTPRGAVLGVRELSDLDREVLQITNEQRAPKVEAGAHIERINHRHREIARLMSLGYSNKAIATELGYAQGTISQLQRTPSFQQLVAQYEGERDDQTGKFRERMAVVGNLALERLEERLVDQPGLIETKDLNKIVENLADRSGTSAPTKSVSLNLGMSASDLAKAKEHARSMRILPNEG